MKLGATPTPSLSNFIFNCLKLEVRSSLEANSRLNLKTIIWRKKWRSISWRKWLMMHYKCPILIPLKLLPNSDNPCFTSITKCTNQYIWAWIYKLKLEDWVWWSIAPKYMTTWSNGMIFSWRKKWTNVIHCKFPLKDKTKKRQKS